jgi:proline iminopeptidase
MPETSHVELYPPIEPYEQGLLDVGDGNRIAWEISGSPSGKPAVVLHGGPGQGSGSGMRRAFNPERYRTILFDQRGCGRSLPHASDPGTDMRYNTTQQLIEDMEKLRERLGVDRWLVSGGSWGSALALAYAEQYPSRVSELVLLSVTTWRRAELAWLYSGLSRFFPEAWDAFRAHVPKARKGDVPTAYAQLMEDANPTVRLAAARAWAAWEDAALALEPFPLPGAFGDIPPDDLIALVRICARYVSTGAWLEDGILIKRAGALAGIPGALIHGRRDLTCPVETAWLLSRAWPGSELVVLDDSGHLGSNSKRAALLRALDRFGEGSTR